VNGEVPETLTETVLDCPVGIEDGDAIGVEAAGGTQGATVTLTAGLSAAGAHWPVTRTQYDVVTVGVTVIELLLVDPPIGLVVTPELPLYHWYVKGPEPAGVSVIVLDWPEVIVDGTATGTGAEGGVQAVTVTVAASLSCGPQTVRRT
jgi:hypothetical protein